jgi:hypothetical protein
VKRNNELLCYDYCGTAAAAVPRASVAGTTKEPKPLTPPFGRVLRALTPAPGANYAPIADGIT